MGKMSKKMGMKKMASMKMGMRKMAMKKSIIAKGRMAKVMVFKGSKVKKTKSGRVVSVKRSLATSRGKAGKWANSLKMAYKKLGLKKFAPCKKGSALYKATMSFYK